MLFQNIPYDDNVRGTINVSDENWDDDWHKYFKILDSVEKTEKDEKEHMGTSVTPNNRQQSIVDSNSKYDMKNADGDHLKINEENPKSFDSSLHWKNVLRNMNTSSMKSNQTLQKGNDLDLMQNLRYPPQDTLNISLNESSNVVKNGDAEKDVGMRKREYISSTSYHRPESCPLENGKKKIALKQYIPTLPRTEHNQIRALRLNRISRQNLM